MSKSKKLIIKAIKKKALGNSNIELKEVASDLLNQIGRDSITQIASGTYLNAATIARVMDCDKRYSPRADTLERIFRFCNAEVSFNSVKINRKFMNQPKER